MLRGFMTIPLEERKSEKLLIESFICKFIFMEDNA